MNLFLGIVLFVVGFIAGFLFAAYFNAKLLTDEDVFPDEDMSYDEYMNRFGDE